MYHQVGITTDRRGEVGVVVEGQAIVADILGAVDGLGHGAQGYRLDKVLFALAFHVLEEFVVGIHQGRAVAEVHRIAQT